MMRPWRIQFEDAFYHIKARSRFDWLSRREILEADGLKGAQSRRGYRQTCLALADKPREFWKDITEKAIIGTDEFVEKIKRKFAPSGRKEELTEYTKLSRPAFDFEDELERVADAFDTEAGRMKQRSKYFPARQAAYLHLVINCGMRPGQVADYFGISPCAVTNGITRIKSQAFDNGDLDKKIRTLSYKGES